MKLHRIVVPSGSIRIVFNSVKLLYSSSTQSTTFAEGMSLLNKQNPHISTEIIQLL